jgi:chorismate mutase
LKLEHGDLPAIRRLEHGRVLVLLKTFGDAVKVQNLYLRTEMLLRPEWSEGGGKDAATK